MISEAGRPGARNWGKSRAGAAPSVVALLSGGALVTNDEPATNGADINAEAGLTPLDDIAAELAGDHAGVGSQECQVMLVILVEDDKDDSVKLLKPNPGRFARILERAAEAAQDGLENLGLVEPLHRSS